jgi:hypothetical protein
LDYYNHKSHIICRLQFLLKLSLKQFHIKKLLKLEKSWE